MLGLVAAEIASAGKQLNEDDNNSKTTAIISINLLVEKRFTKSPIWGG